MCFLQANPETISRLRSLEYLSSMRLVPFARTVGNTVVRHLGVLMGTREDRENTKAGEETRKTWRQKVPKEEGGLKLGV